MRLPGVVLLAFPAAACVAHPTAPTTTLAAQHEADLVFTGGDVETMDARKHARAVAVSDGKIVYVGDDAAPFIGKKTRVVDLAGRSVAPALTDAHAHLSALGETLDQNHLYGCKSPEDCASKLRPMTPWVRGGGWDQNRFADPKFPTHAVLDRKFPDVPVWLHRIDGHAGWANAKALALAHVDKSTPDPQGGRILHDEKGEPTGVLVDNAMDLVEKVIPKPSAQELEQFLLRAQAIVLENGITSVHEMGIDDDTVRAYRKLAAEKKLRVRVYAYRAFQGLAMFDEKPDASVPFSFFTVRGVKLFADGALGSRGAALLEPYSDDPGNKGLFVTPPAVLEAATKKAVATGWQIATHAIGDAANRTVLDAYQHAGCTPAQRFRIEHAQVLALSDIPRLRAMGVIASMQPKHATSDMGWAEARLGKDRLAGAYAWRRVIDSGARVAWGSDFPVEGVSLIEGLVSATTRTDEDGKPAGGWIPEQKVTLDEALRGFSLDAARAAFEDSWRGRVAVGQAADLTVFDRDLTKGSVAGAKVAMTVVGGKIEYEH